MPGAAGSSLTLYLEVVFVLFAVASALALYALLRLVLGRTLAAGGGTAGAFLAGLILPAVFILAALSFKLNLVRQSFPFGPKFYQFVDAALVFFIAFFVLRLLNAAFVTWFARRRKPFPLPKVLHGLILTVVYLAVLFVVLKQILGINITPFLATSAILTMILGLALQGVLSNILAGMSLHFTRSFDRGDWIKVRDIEGVVMDTTWRETRIVDRASNVIVIPNNTVASELLTNFFLPDRKTALTFPVRASFEAPPADVQEALLEAAYDVPEVLSSPAPLAFIRGYDDLGISYLLKFWVTDFARKESILSSVGRLIWYKFRRRGIEIPVPVGSRVADLLSAVRKEEPGAAADEEGALNFRDLLRSSFLRFPEGRKAGRLVVPEREVKELATAARRKRYTAGEVLFRQGERGETCYVVASGMVRGEIIYEEKGKKYSSEFKVGPGGIFGEMSLFTGMARTATGFVEAESELLEIGSEAFARVLRRDPGLAEVMAEIVALRNRRNESFLKKIKELSAQEIAASCNKRSILQRLRGLVGRLRAGA